MDFERLFQDTEPSVKLYFLYSLLVKNERLRNQFSEFCKQAGSKERDGQDQNATLRLIIEKERECKSELEAIDFEDMDWGEYVPRHTGYIPEDEAMEDMAEEQLTVVFSGWQASVTRLIENGQLLQAICVLLGAYDACLTATIKGEDDIYDDFKDNLLQFHEQLMDEVIPVVECTVKSDEQCILSIEAVIQNYKQRHNGITGYLKHFEPFLITLVENGDIAEKILATIRSTAIDEALLSGLIVKLYSFGENRKEWIKKAEQFLYDDLDVAKQALDFYWQHDALSFTLHGKELFRIHPYELCDFFRERLYPAFDREFFRDVLWFQTLRDKTVDLYEELREYLDESDKQDFLKEIKYDEVFKVMVLGMEKKYNEILEFVRNEVKHTWHFDEMITPILNIFPQEVAELIRIKINHTIEHEKGRHSYQRICRWLKLGLQIRGKEDEMRHMIQDLYSRKPALPALRDEMRKAGVVESNN